MRTASHRHHCRLRCSPRSSFIILIRLNGLEDLDDVCEVGRRREEHFLVIRDLAEIPGHERGEER